MFNFKILSVVATCLLSGCAGQVGHEAPPGPYTLIEPDLGTPSLKILAPQYLKLEAGGKAYLLLEFKRLGWMGPLVAHIVRDDGEPITAVASALIVTATESTGAVLVYTAELTEPGTYVTTIEASDLQGLHVAKTTFELDVVPSAKN